MSLEVLWPPRPRNTVPPHPLSHGVFLHPPSGFQLGHRCSEMASLTPKTGVGALFFFLTFIYFGVRCLLCCEGFPPVVEGKGYALVAVLRLLTAGASLVPRGLQ